MGSIVAVSKRRILAVGVALAAIAVPATAWAVTAPIRNGGFERPVVGAGSYQRFSTGQTFKHRKVIGAPGEVAVVSGTFTQGGCSFPAKSGNQWLDLTGIGFNSATGVQQTVGTTPNATYTVHFSVGNVYNPGGAFGTTSTVRVLVNGIQVKTVTNSSRALNTQVWAKFKAHFTAHTDVTKIRFVNGDPPSDNNNGLDAVRLTQP